MDPRTIEAASTTVPTRCPECAGSGVSLAGVTPHFVSLRCTGCGEVWLVRERRKLPRASAGRIHGDASTFAHLPR